MTGPEKLRYPIGRERDQPEFGKSFDHKLKSELIEVVRQLPSNLEYAIQNLNAEQLDTPYRPGGWSVYQLVHHIADSHMNAYIRFKLGLTEDNPVIKPYNQDAWADLPDTRSLPVNISITLLFALHARLCGCIEGMTDDQWKRTVYHPEKKEKITMWQLLISYGWHSRHHVAHIEQLRKKMNWH